MKRKKNNEQNGNRSSPYDPCRQARCPCRWLRYDGWRRRFRKGGTYGKWKKMWDNEKSENKNNIFLLLLDTRQKVVQEFSELQVFEYLSCLSPSHFLNQTWTNIFVLSNPLFLNKSNELYIFFHLNTHTFPNVCVLFISTLSIFSSMNNTSS